MLEFSAQEKRVVIFLFVFFIAGLAVAYYRSKTANESLHRWRHTQSERFQEFKTINQRFHEQIVTDSLAAVRVKQNNQSRKQKLVYKIDLNTAGMEELQTLDRIGPVLAQRIVAHRNQKGPFKDVEELLKVEGIGPKTLARIRDNICVK